MATGKLGGLKFDLVIPDMSEWVAVQRPLPKEYLVCCQVHLPLDDARVSTPGDCCDPNRKRMCKGDHSRGLRCVLCYTVLADTSQMSRVSLCLYAFNLTRQSICEVSYACVWRGDAAFVERAV